MCDKLTFRDYNNIKRELARCIKDDTPKEIFIGQFIGIYQSNNKPCIIAQEVNSQGQNWFSIHAVSIIRRGKCYKGIYYNPDYQSWKLPTM